MTKSGDLDGEFTYLYNGHQIIEVRNGADDVELLVVHGTRYIDEIVCQRVKDRGWAYVHQDANWNVTALTAMNGAVIERYWYKPYGEFVAAAEYGWFDYDQDGDVDSSDLDPFQQLIGCPYSTQACRCLDADGDRDVDSADYAIISDYVSTLTADTQLQRVPAAPSTRRGNPFAHQGLLYDAEIGSYVASGYHYRPALRRYNQPGLKGLPRTWFPNAYSPIGRPVRIVTSSEDVATCTVQVKADGVHLYVWFEQDGQDGVSGTAEWGPCGFIGMCPCGDIDPDGPDGPLPSGEHPDSMGGCISGIGGSGDDGGTPNGGPGPQSHTVDPDAESPCQCLGRIMGTKFRDYLFCLVNSNSAAMWAAQQCGVETTGITGYAGQGVAPTPVH